MRTNKLAALAAVSLLLGFLAAGVQVTACHNTTPDQFLNATVDCARVDPQAGAALAAVETCLMSVVASNPAACLAGLVTEIHFTVDTVACVVAYIAQQNQAKVAAGTYTIEDLRARQAANDWLAAEHIQIRNSYTPAR
jgi:predicted naringenin-chalcone synthase